MTELPDGYYAVLDPADPATMTYWRVRNGNVTPWPARAKYGPVFLRKDGPSRGDDDAYRAHVRRVVDELNAWHNAVFAALAVDDVAARARFAALKTRCFVCCRVLTDPATKVGGIGPECRAGFPAEYLDALAAAVAEAHAEVTP